MKEDVEIVVTPFPEIDPDLAKKPLSKEQIDELVSKYATDK